METNTNNLLSKLTSTLLILTFLVSCGGTKFGQGGQAVTDDGSVDQNEKPPVVGDNPKPPVLDSNFEYNDVFSVSKKTERKEAAVDLLFVVDNSGSMADEQAILASSFDQFIDKFTQRNVDYRIGITTTDLNREKGDLIKDQSHNDYILDPNVLDVEAKFKSSIKLPFGSGHERALLASISALDESNVRPNSAAQLGFFRENADLAIIMVSDENGDELLRTPEAKNQRIHDFTKAFTGHVSKYNKKLFFYTITQQNRNSTFLATAASLNNLNFNRTANFDLSRNRDFSGDIIQIGDSISETVVAKTSYTLSRKAKEDSIEVTVDDEVLSDSDYRYDAVANTVNIDIEDLSDKQEIRIRYKQK